MTISLTMILLLFPLLIFVSLIVLLSLGRPILFTQIRPGLYERTFKILKFRTMHNINGVDGELLPDIKRITKVGSFLRKTSLDELPELFNVLLGHMSIVGPRPLILRYIPFYTVSERKRHSVRPGITGLAQINGRNFLNWDERLALDIKYVENLSFALDIKIILKTIIVVIKFKNIGLHIIPDLDEMRKVSE